MNFSELKRVPIVATNNVKQEKTDDQKIAQNIAFAKLKARVFQPTPTEELVDRVLRLCQPIRK